MHWAAERAVWMGGKPLGPVGSQVATGERLTHIGNAPGGDEDWGGSEARHWEKASLVRGRLSTDLQKRACRGHAGCPVWPGSADVHCVLVNGKLGVTVSVCAGPCRVPRGGEDSGNGELCGAPAAGPQPEPFSCLKEGFA